MFKEYIIQNWAIILLLVAFIIVLKTTVFLDKKMIRRMYLLIAFLFVFSLLVFLEFYFAERGELKDLRTVLVAIRYSTTPFIIAMVIFTLVAKARAFVFIPAATFMIVNIISIFTGIVFSITDDNVFVRGPLGFLPFVAVGLYCIFFVYTMIKHSNKRATEIIPIMFLSFAFVSGLILPFILGSDYSKIFCVTIIIALFVYYVFSILQLTKKDSLTNLSNRQAYYAAIKDSPKEISAVVSIDMNGLKVINDTNGHAAGDEALKTLASCFMSSVNYKQTVYRIGGDEFVILCRKTSEKETKELVKRIEDSVNETSYSCATGYSVSDNGNKSLETMLKESDEMMYAQKAQHYSKEK